MALVIMSGCPTYIPIANIASYPKSCLSVGIAKDFQVIPISVLVQSSVHSAPNWSEVHSGNQRASNLRSVWCNSQISRISTLRPTISRQARTVCELGGQYDESFTDVEKYMLNCFTFKAVRSVLGQLQETNPPQYAFFYNFVVDNKPQDGKIFLQTLLKEKQELGERVMVTRLHLFNTWIKGYNHADMYKAMSDQNLELLRERLVQTVKFTEDTERPQPPPTT